MRKYIFLFTIFFTSCFAIELKVASYNVQNLFDLNYDKTEYKEYIPNTKANWNKNTYNTKLKNLVKVIKELDANIIALQEVESIKVLKDLRRKLPRYRYISLLKYKNSAVGLGFLSDIKILHNKKISVKFKDKLFRPIMETTFYYENVKFKIFNNHWPSKKVAESYRIKYAYTLLNRIKQLPKDYDYIILGDLNSNYDEKQTLYLEKNLDDSLKLTGINDILNTIDENRFITKTSILNLSKNLHYNLWLELPQNERFSYIFRGKNTTLDNILLPYSMFDGKKISYINNSFKVFKPKYLYKNRKINSWQIKRGVHQNKGFSDHLPILASFELKPYEKKQQNITSIKDLYKVTHIDKPFIVKDAVVIYKNNKSAIIKQKNNHAIFIYDAKNLKEFYSYDLKIFDIKSFHGLKEVKSFAIIKEKNKINNIEDYYLNSNYDLTKLKYQNEVVKNLEVIYKNRYAYYNNKKIRLYFKNKKLIPKNNTKLLLKKAHIGYFRQEAQLVIYKNSDFKLLY
ncbi:endonuclease [Malaciobacter halophilus]|uniref:Endonuclease n=1 Tax=Malaciobacter halophilus TaxID=197482 RepID=A0A2N1J236_9BACT|nr:endonuclease/exonuclease/phosphatase family protein [Malaciobacter halophilus]AXH10135.1 endonuclease/exonuclease/phosphatase [Malaciobacter halophilus]PKI80616.1 endonuclease [Malaciobacter halophilus]